jgi:hypothetical protein
MIVAAGGCFLGTRPRAEKRGRHALVAECQAEILEAAGGSVVLEHRVEVDSAASARGLQPFARRCHLREGECGGRGPEQLDGLVGAVDLGRDAIEAGSADRETVDRFEDFEPAAASFRDGDSLRHEQASCAVHFRRRKGREFCGFAATMRQEGTVLWSSCRPPAAWHGSRHHGRRPAGPAPTPAWPRPPPLRGGVIRISTSL